MYTKISPKTGKHIVITLMVNENSWQTLSGEAKAGGFLEVAARTLAGGIRHRQRNMWPNIWGMLGREGNQGLSLLFPNRWL